jgi:hypothetical protein
VREGCLTNSNVACARSRSGGWRGAEYIIAHVTDSGIERVSRRDGLVEADYATQPVEFVLVLVPATNLKGAPADDLFRVGTTLSTEVLICVEREVVEMLRYVSHYLKVAA